MITENTNLCNYELYETFKSELEQGLIREDMICFIKDKNIIWTHGHEYSAKDNVFILNVENYEFADDADYADIVLTQEESDNLCDALLNGKTILFKYVMQADPNDESIVSTRYELVTHSLYEPYGTDPTASISTCRGSELVDYTFLINENKIRTLSYLSLLSSGASDAYLAADGNYHEIESATESNNGLMTSEHVIQLASSRLIQNYTLPEGVTEEDLTPVNGDDFSVGIAKLHKAILDNEEVVAAAVSVINENLGFTINGVYNPTSTELQNKTVTEALDYMLTKIGEGGGGSSTDPTEVIDAQKGQPDGIASLDANGLVPTSQLPSYVDDVIDAYATYTDTDGELSDIALYSDAAHTTPITGETGKIYIDITEGGSNYQFRWSGTAWVFISAKSLVIGEVTGTAFDGGRGKALEDWKTEATKYNYISSCDLYSVISDGEDAYEEGTNYQYISIIRQFIGNNDSEEVTIDKYYFNTCDNVTVGMVEPSQFNKWEGYGTSIESLNTWKEALNDLVYVSTVNTVSNPGIFRLQIEQRRFMDGQYSTEPWDIDLPIADDSTAGIINAAQFIKWEGYANTIQEIQTRLDTTSTAAQNAKDAVDTHAARIDNPHGVTAEQLGLGTSDEVTFSKVSAVNGFWEESDERIKSNIQNLEHTLDEICNIPTVRFDIHGQERIGTTAQGVEAVEPLLVSENVVPASSVPDKSQFEVIKSDDGEEYVKLKVVEYQNLSVLAIEGIKLLRNEIDKIKRHLNIE